MVNYASSKRKGFAANRAQPTAAFVKLTAKKPSSRLLANVEQYRKVD